MPVEPRQHFFRVVIVTTIYCLDEALAVKDLPNERGAHFNSERGGSKRESL
jgi:hypothetical protein